MGPPAKPSARADSLPEDDDGEERRFDIYFIIL
jgi:hypothetical protein